MSRCTACHDHPTSRSHPLNPETQHLPYPAHIFAGNLLVGTALLAFILTRYGAPALDLLAASVTPSLFAAFLIWAPGDPDFKKIIT